MIIPGITICIGADTPKTEYQPPSGTQAWLKHESFGGAGCSGTLSHHGAFYQNGVVVHPETGVGIAMDGWALPPEDLSGDQVLAGWLETYLRKGIAFVESLNGAFNVAIWDPRVCTVYLANDRYGLRPMCHGVYNGRHYLSPQARRILELSRQEPKLNDQAFYNLLTYSRAWAGVDTLYQGIRSMPPATILTWKCNQFSEYQYWDYRFTPLPELDESYVDQAVETFKRAVARHMGPWARIGINLSGGLDSRAIAAALGEDLRRRATAFTWGYAPYCQEAQLASTTAEICKIPWHFIKVEPEDFLSQARVGIRITEGRDLAVQSYGLKVFPEVAERCDVSVAGLAFDILGGGSYCSTIVNTKLRSTDDYARQILDRCYYFRTYTGEMFIDKEQAMHHLNALEMQFHDDLKTDSASSPADIGDRFALRQRCWRTIFPRQQWQRLYVEDVVPTFDNELVDILLQLHFRHRANHEFFRLFLARLNQKCMDVPYQRTLLPPSVPSQYWAEALQIEKNREDLLRRIYYETGGHVYVPYHRYYSNFDEWLRINYTWKSLVNELLLTPGCLLSKNFLRSQWVREIVDEQERGQVAHYSRLVVLMTAELILRELFS